MENWINKGACINEKYLQHLRFADDIVAIAEYKDEHTTLIKELMSPQT